MGSTSTTPGEALQAMSPDSDPAILAPVSEHDDLRVVARAILSDHAGFDHLLSTIDVPAAQAAAQREQLWSLLTSELDVAGMAVPERLGGSGYGLRELGVVLEEAGASLVSAPLLSSAVLGVQALLMADDPSVVQDLLSDAVRGTRLLTVWFGQQDTLRADQTPTGWVVTGLATRVLDGDAVGHVVVPARSETGTVLLLADLSSTAAVRREGVDPTRIQADLELSAAPALLIAGPATAAAVLARLATLRDLAVSAEHAGIVAHLLDLTVDFVRTRQQFGRPIGSFQAIKHRLADVLVDRERCLSASRYAAAMFDADPGGAAVAAAVAAAVTTGAVVRVAHEAVQLHGGIGFTWEHQAHLYVRRALADEGMFGSAHQHRLRLADLLAL